MIAAEPSTYMALEKRQLAMRLRVRWYLDGDNGIDVSDRVVAITPIERSVGPFLSGYSVSDCTITLENTDGRFTTSSASSYLSSGPTRYNMTPMSVEQGIRRANGTFEYFDVFHGRVHWVQFTRGQLEVKIVSRFTMLMGMPLPEQFSFGEYSSAGWTKTLETAVPTLIKDYSIFTDSDIATTDLDYIFCGLAPTDMGWSVSGMLPQGSSIGRGLQDLCISGLATVCEKEDGLITMISEVLPRNWCGRRQGSSDFPVTFDDTNSEQFQLIEGLRTTATEVVVEYQGSTASYRNTSDETYVGRVTQYIGLPFARHYHNAAWAARLVYEHSKQFPVAISFGTVGHGLLVQLNDRIQFKDPETATLRVGRVVSKVWSREAVSIGAIVDSSESAIFDGTFALADSTSWDDSTEIAL